jgi:hypothetical protein
MWLDWTYWPIENSTEKIAKEVAPIVNTSAESHQSLARVRVDLASLA